MYDKLWGLPRRVFTLFYLNICLCWLFSLIYWGSMDGLDYLMPEIYIISLFGCLHPSNIFVIGIWKKEYVTAEVIPYHTMLEHK